MTNEEAIKFLSQIKDALLASNSWLPSTHNPIKESFGMAINALTKEAWKEEHPVSPLLQKLATNLQPSKQDDLISRQAAIDAIKTWGLIDGLSEGQAIEILADEEKLPSAQPEKRTEERTETHACDYIDRQAAIDAIEEMQMPIMRSMFPEEQFVFRGMSESLNAIKELPSAQPDLSEYSDKLWKKAYERGKAEAQAEIIACGDCKHWICHDRRCGYWNHGVRAIDWCSHAERRTDGRSDQQKSGD